MQLIDLLQSHELMQVSGSLGSLGWEAQDRGMTVGVVLRPDPGEPYQPVLQT